MENTRETELEWLKEDFSYPIYIIDEIDSLSEVLGDNFETYKDRLLDLFRLLDDYSKRSKTIDPTYLRSRMDTVLAHLVAKDLYINAYTLERRNNILHFSERNPPLRSKNLMLIGPHYKAVLALGERKFMILGEEHRAPAKPCPIEDDYFRNFIEDITSFEEDEYEIYQKYITSITKWIEEEKPRCLWIQDWLLKLGIEGKKCYDVFVEQRDTISEEIIHGDKRDPRSGLDKITFLFNICSRVRDKSFSLTCESTS